MGLVSYSPVALLVYHYLVQFTFYSTKYFPIELVLNFISTYTISKNFNFLSNLSSSVEKRKLFYEWSRKFLFFNILFSVVYLNNLKGFVYEMFDNDELELDYLDYFHYKEYSYDIFKMFFKSHLMCAIPQIFIIFLAFKIETIIYRGIHGNNKLAKRKNVKWETTSNVSRNKQCMLISLICMLIYMPFSLDKRQFYLINSFSYYLINAYMMVWNFWCFTKWKQIKFEMQIVTDKKIALGNLINYLNLRQQFTKNANIEFYFPILNADSDQFANEKCLICFESKPDTHYCEHHCFHLKCIIRYLYSKVENINMMYSIENTPGNNDEIYTITLDKENLPTCPHCRQYTDLDELKVEIVDKENKKAKVIINK